MWFYGLVSPFEGPLFGLVGSSGSLRAGRSGNEVLLTLLLGVAIVKLGELFLCNLGTDVANEMINTPGN